MEYVKAFNAELAGLYECKPPISKAKMTAITKSGIRAIKFYKHVVQSVEKFIQKCKTEYKVPGLYVIDSLVRQSRHQFSIEKDVFAPRFAKNITITFYYIFKCPQEEKSKVIRVLNLWQKNHIFSEDVIQPLFDLADPNHAIHKEVANIISQKANKVKAPPQAPQPPQQPSQQFTPTLQHTPQRPHTPLQTTPQPNVTHQAPSVPPSMNSNTTPGHPLSSAMGQDASAIPGMPNLDPNLIHQLQQILMKTTEESPVVSAVAALGLQQTSIPALSPFAQASVASSTPNNSMNLLNSTPTSASLPAPPSGLEPNAQNLAVPRLSSDYDGRTLPFLPVDTSQPPPGFNIAGVFGVMAQHQSPMAQNVAPPPHLGQNPPLPHLGHNIQPPVAMPVSPMQPRMQGDASFPLNQTPAAADPEVIEIDEGRSPKEEGEHSESSEENKENLEEVRSERRRRSRSRSHSRSKRRRRSRSRSRHRRSRSRSRRSRSRDRRDRSRRDRERDRESQREKDRERKKKGLPTVKRDHLSVCSTTLWVGHLSKLTHQEDLSDTFGEYGDIVSIDLIPPRGCAFICMNRRQDASRALSKLKHHKMHGKPITIAWAPGKGMKGKQYKDYWEVDRGCSYIPYKKLSKLSNVDLDAFEDGGVIDEDTVPSWLKGRYTAEDEAKDAQESVPVSIESGPSHGAHHAPGHGPHPPGHGAPPPHQHMVGMVMPPQREPDLGPARLPPEPSDRLGPLPLPLSLDKDDRSERRHLPPPHIVPHFGVAAGLPHGSGLPLIGASLAPGLRLPPAHATMRIRPFTIGPVLGQPRLGAPLGTIGTTASRLIAADSAPAATTILNSEVRPNAAAMDVQMEDIKPEHTKMSVGRDEPVGLTEHLAAVSETSLGAERGAGPNGEVNAPAPTPPTSSEPTIMGPDLVQPTPEMSMRSDALREPGFVSGLPPRLQRPFGPRPIGLIHHEGQGFEPRPHVPFVHSRPLLTTPGLGTRPEMVSDLVGRPGPGPTLLRPRSLEIRAGVPPQMGELLPPGVRFPPPGQRLAAPPGPVLNRFGLVRAPQPFPPTRFGARPPLLKQPLLPQPNEDRKPGEWIGQARSHAHVGGVLEPASTEQSWKAEPKPRGFVPTQEGQEGMGLSEVLLSEAGSGGSLPDNDREKTNADPRQSVSSGADRGPRSREEEMVARDHLRLMEEEMSREGGMRGREGDWERFREERDREWERRREWSRARDRNRPAPAAEWSSRDEWREPRDNDRSFNRLPEPDRFQRPDDRHPTTTFLDGPMRWRAESTSAPTPNTQPRPMQSATPASEPDHFAANGIALNQNIDSTAFTDSNQEDSNLAPGESEEPIAENHNSESVPDNEEISNMETDGANGETDPIGGSFESVDKETTNDIPEPQKDRVETSDSFHFSAETASFLEDDGPNTNDDDVIPQRPSDKIESSSEHINNDLHLPSADIPISCGASKDVHFDDSQVNQDNPAGEVLAAGVLEESHNDISPNEASGRHPVDLPSAAVPQTGSVDEAIENNCAEISNNAICDEPTNQNAFGNPDFAENSVERIPDDAQTSDNNNALCGEEMPRSDADRSSYDQAPSDAIETPAEMRADNNLNPAEMRADNNLPRSPVSVVAKEGLSAEGLDCSVKQCNQAQSVSEDATNHLQETVQNVNDANNISNNDDESL